MIAARAGLGQTTAESSNDEREVKASAGSSRVADADLDVVASALTDPQAFAPLYDRYFDAVFGYCLRRIGNPDDAADATSQIFVNALQGLSRFRASSSWPGSSFRSWLFSVAHNVVVDVYRTRRPTTALESRDRDPKGVRVELEDASPSPEDLAILVDSERGLAVALRQLPERQRSIIEFRLAGLSHAEIASVLGLSGTAVRSAQYRGISRLRTLLQPDDPTQTPGDSR